jgi:NADH-quinone oxidoreductase subunit C
MSGTDSGDSRLPHDGIKEPSDAPGALSATTGEVAPSGQSSSAPKDTAVEAGTETIHGCPVTCIAGATVVHCHPESYVELCQRLRDDGYAMPIGLTGVDYLTHPGRQLPAEITPERFEVVLELLDLAHHRRIRVRCQVRAQDPVVPSLFQIWPGTEYHERETYDMFGIRFDGHPDLTRILMPEDWEGHPLRKDYDTGHVPVQFKEAPRGGTI